MSKSPNTEPAREKATPACPICGKPRDAKYDPFCSRRCSEVDLYRWLKGGYVIPGAERPSEDPNAENED